MQRIMEVLLGSKQPRIDRHHFMKTQVLFFLLGSIDGHAKNFSIFHTAGGRYQLTPMYDVTSAYPLTAKRQLDLKKLKMGMSVRGSTNRYEHATIFRRHWVSTAAVCHFPAEEIEAIIDELLGEMETVIAQVAEQLPPSFPQDVADPIFEGMKRAANRLQG